MKVEKPLAKGPVRILSIATVERRDMALPGVALLRNRHLRQSGVEKVLNDRVPVHAHNHKRKCACFASVCALNFSITIAQ